MYGVHSVASALLGLVCLSALACGDPAAPEIDSVDVALVNDAEEAIHIVKADEEFGPGNRIGPGGSRTTSLGARNGDPVPFRAGRNIGQLGEVLVSVHCHYTNISNPGGGRLVVYTEDSGPALVCVNWTQ